MTEAQKTVLNLTSAALFGTPVTIPSETDWQAVYDEIKSQEVVALLYPLSLDLDIPKDVLKQWSEDRDKYLLNNAKNISGHFAVQKLMDEAGIPCVILKGLASASYYPDYLLRAYGDVDFLVPKEDYRKASKFLEKNGFDYLNRHDRHLIYSRGGILYELHKDIVGLPTTSIRKVFYEYFSDIFDSATPFEHRGSICMIPSSRHHSVILLVHMAWHLSKSGVGLRHLCDWAVFVNSMPDSFFENDMQEVLKEMGLWHFAEILTSLCEEYLGLQRHSWVDRPSVDYLSALIDDIFDAGAFGRIHDEAVLKNPTLKTRRADLISAETLKAFFASLNKGARTVIPASSEHPILLPAGWTYVMGRYMIRTLSGKRSVGKARENIVRLGKRKELSEEWQLFESQEKQL